MEATMIDAKTESLDSSRGDARISVAKKWADRRKLKENQQRGESGNAINAKPVPVKPVPEKNLRPPIPPLCVLLRRSWNQTVNTLIQIQHQQQQHRNISALNTGNKPKAAGRESSVQQQKPANAWRSSALGKQENNKRVTFPSVLSVLKANAIKLQVESMTENDDDEMDSGRLNVLPSSCNDFTTSAVNHMADSRSRAFHLLDFSAIVQTHTVWRKRLGIPLKLHKDVQMVYSARHNSNARLLRLLQRLGVGLRVATKYDLAAVRQAIGSDLDERSAMIWDDTSILVKPDSFYRNLLLSHNRNDDEDEDSTETKRTIPITVGDADEMERIHKQLHKICMRRREPQNGIPNLNFVLKLDNETDDFQKWKTILRKMHETALELPNTMVVGVALELCGIDETKVPEENTCISILDELSELIENWVEDQPLPETPAAETIAASKPQVHLTNPVTATEIDDLIIKWIGQHRKLCNGITIDASRLLMANAAALCTRIIGVKNNESNPEKRGNVDGKGNVDGESPVDEAFQREQKAAPAIQQHLYIDDGCYGSLSNYPNEGIPLPLKSQRFMRTLSATSKELVEREQKTLVNTTVWGPTCKYIESTEVDIVFYIFDLY